MMLFVNTMSRSNENENAKMCVQANRLFERQHNSCATTLEPREMYISSTWDKIINAKYIYKRQQSKKEIKWIAIAGKIQGSMQWLACHSYVNRTANLGHCHPTFYSACNKTEIYTNNHKLQGPLIGQLEKPLGTTKCA